MILGSGVTRTSLITTALPVAQRPHAVCAELSTSIGGVPGAGERSGNSPPSPATCRRHGGKAWINSQEGSASHRSSACPASTWASVPHSKLAQGPVGATCPWEMGLEMESLCTGICSIIRREAVFMGGWSGGLTHGILGSTRIWKV